MSTPIQEIAAWIHAEIVGDPNLSIKAAKPLSDDPTADDITVVLDAKNATLGEQSAVRVVVVPRGVLIPNKTCLVVADPFAAFVAIVQKLHVKPITPMRGIHPSAVVDPTAKLAPDVVVGPHVWIGEGAVIGARTVLQHGASVGPHCQLGDDVVLAPHVVLYAGTVLHNRVCIHANCVIGADGFGYRLVHGKHVKLPQVGYVEIEDDVEIGACTTIDRAALGVTRIGAGTKIDNLVMIAHNCQLGKNNIIVAQVGMAGSVSTGDYVVMGGQVGISDHVHIGDRTQLGAKSGVHNDIPPDQLLLGVPARPIAETRRLYATLERLPDLRKDVKDIKKHLGLS